MKAMQMVPLGDLVAGIRVPDKMRQLLTLLWPVCQRIPRCGHLVGPHVHTSIRGGEDTIGDSHMMLHTKEEGISPQHEREGSYLKRQ